MRRYSCLTAASRSRAGPLVSDTPADAAAAIAWSMAAAWVISTPPCRSASVRGSEGRSDGSGLSGLPGGRTVIPVLIGSLPIDGQRQPFGHLQVILPGVFDRLVPDGQRQILDGPGRRRIGHWFGLPIWLPRLTKRIQWRQPGAAWCMSSRRGSRAYSGSSGSTKATRPPARSTSSIADANASL